MANIPNPNTGPQYYWRIMRSLQRAYGSFALNTVIEIVGNRSHAALNKYVNALLDAGVLAIEKTTRYGCFETRHFQIVRDGEALPLIACGRRQQAIWTAIRALKMFSPAEIAIAASTEALPIKDTTVRPYLSDLHAAGYLVHLERGQYRLLPSRNTGPRAPIILRQDRAAFDVNLMRRVNLNETQATGRAA